MYYIISWGDLFDGASSNYIFTPSSRFWMTLHKVCDLSTVMQQVSTGARDHDVHHFVLPHLDSRTTCSFYKVVAAGITDYGAIPRQPVMPLVKDRKRRTNSSRGTWGKCSQVQTFQWLLSSLWDGVESLLGRSWG